MQKLKLLENFNDTANRVKSEVDLPRDRGFTLF